MFGIPWETTQIVERRANEHDLLHARGPNVSYLRQWSQAGSLVVATKLRKIGACSSGQRSYRGNDQIEARCQTRQRRTCALPPVANSSTPVLSGRVG